MNRRLALAIDPSLDPKLDWECGFGYARDYRREPQFCMFDGTPLIEEETRTSRAVRLFRRCATPRHPGYELVAGMWFGVR